MSIEDTLVRRQVFIQRFGNGEARRASDMLIETYGDIENVLLQETEFLAFVLVQLRDDIDRILANGFSEISEDVNDAMLEFARAEAQFTYQALSVETSVVLSRPEVIQIERMVLAEGMDVAVGVGELTMNEAIDNFSLKKSAQVRQVIGDGILEGKTTQQVANEIKDLGKHMHKSQIEALVRTTTNNATSMARNAVTLENAELFEGEEWLATLDNRTTLICAGRDGRIIPIGRPPYPPAHWNCRSLRVPVLKEEFRIDDDTARRPEIGSSGRGTTSASTTFDPWLRRQSAGFQDEYFSQFPDGLEKAALFRRGGLGIQDFRNETGVNYTLEQLAGLEPLAFSRANIALPTNN